MNLNVPQVKSDHFSHYLSEKELVAEHSTLNNVRFGRLYDDACDAGIELINVKTQNTTRWYLSEKKYSGEELEYSVLKPTPESIRKNPAMVDYKMIILND